jgi:hypothetical protein
MPLGQVVNLYFDTTKYGSSSSILLQGLTSPNTQPSQGLIGGDIFTLILWPRATSGVQGAATTTVQLANPSEMGFTGKLTTNLGATTTLFSVFGFTEQVDGNGNYSYSAILSLDTDELLGSEDGTVIGALNGKTSINVMGEIENFGALIGGVTQELRLQFPLVIYPPVYNGTEGSPQPGSPSYYNTAQSDARYAQNTPAGGSYEIVPDGAGGFLFKLWNPTQAKFQSVYLTGAAGAEQLVIGQN